MLLKAKSNREMNYRIMDMGMQNDRYMNCWFSSDFPFVLLATTTKEKKF